MSSPRVDYTPRPDATPDGEAAVLGSVYRFIIDCCQTKKNAAGVPSTNGDDAMKGFKNDRAPSKCT